MNSFEREINEKKAEEIAKLYESELSNKKTEDIKNFYDNLYLSEGEKYAFEWVGDNSFKLCYVLECLIFPSYKKRFRNSFMNYMDNKLHQDTGYMDWLRKLHNKDEEV